MVLMLDAAGQVAALLPPTGRIMLSRHLEVPPLAMHLNSESNHSPSTQTEFLSTLRLLVCAWPDASMALGGSHVA
jgi:hypothetical protein